MVIWDNNDFREETPSGEGTTHNTSGLLVQRIGCVDDGTESIPCINIESKHLPKKTHVDPPPNILEVCIMKECTFVAGKDQEGTKRSRQGKDRTR